MTESSTRDKLSVGAALMVGAQFFQRFLGIISLIILARLLTPEDFGAVAVIVGIYAVVSDATNLNMGASMIQMQNLKDAHINTAWSLNIVRGALLFMVISLIAIFSNFFGDIKGLGPAIAFIALLPLIESLNNSGMICFEKQMNYKPRFINTLCAKFVGFFATIFLAYVLHNYWAMLGGLMATSATMVVMSYFQSNHRPRLCFSEWRPMVSFSAWLVGTNLLSSISQRISLFMVAAHLSLQQAGQFNMAGELGRLVQSHITFPLQNVLFPALSKYNHDVAALIANYLRARKILISLLLPLGIGVSLTSDEIVSIVLGDGWEIVPPILAVISAATSLSLYTIGFEQVMLALGKTKVLFTRQLIGSILVILSTLIGILAWGLWGMILANVATAAIMIVINIRLLTSTLNINGAQLAKGVVSPVIAALSMVLCCRYLAASVDLIAMGVVVSLLLKVIVGALSYIVTHVTIWLMAGRPESLETELIPLWSSLRHK